MSLPWNAQTHTATSWARVNHEMQFRSIIQKVEALHEETRRNRAFEAESHQMVQYLQARLHALAAAVADLPQVFEGGVREVVAEQERLQSDLVLCRQQMREHKAEVTAMLVEARKAQLAAATSEHAALSARVAAVEDELAAAVALQQRLAQEAVEWDQLRRRLEHEEARTADQPVEIARLGSGTAHQHHGLLAGRLALPCCSPYPGRAAEPCSSL